MKKNKGITLVALIITIIILLILAGITISTLSESGLFSKAKETTDIYSKEEATEKLKLILMEYHMEEYSTTKNYEEGIFGFLKQKQDEKKIKSVDKVNEDPLEIEVVFGGYLFIIDEKGNILENVQKDGQRPIIDEKSIKITLEDGVSVPDDFSQLPGTPLIISFLVSFEDGEILEVEPSGAKYEDGKVTYKTNGTDKKIKFKVLGTINGEEKIKTKILSVSEKYILTISSESIIKGVENIKETTYAILKVNGYNTEKGNELIEYNANCIVYNGNLTLDGTKQVEGATLLNNVYEFGNASTDVATSSSETEGHAKNMVILKVNGDLTINEGITLTACKSADGFGGPKGMIIYSTGTIINNGSISMTARGAKTPGENVYLWKNDNNNFEYIPAVGASGGIKHSSNIVCSGEDASSQKKRATGGGGTGGRYVAEGSIVVGRGGNGTSYSGGAGSGAAGVTDVESKQGSDIGGAGGNAEYKYRSGFDGTSYRFFSGGIGNSNGIHGYDKRFNGDVTDEKTGTGGLLIIYSKNIKNTGDITAKGINANKISAYSTSDKIWNTSRVVPGGASGGGSINIFYEEEKDIKDFSMINVNGGNASDYYSGAGGTGSISIGQIVNGQYRSDNTNY